MKLSEWVEREGRGALTTLQRESGLAYSTVVYAARGKPVSYRTAELLSSATDGEVSVESLMIPAETSVA